jgi:hypothetical protein
MITGKWSLDEDIGPFVRRTFLCRQLVPFHCNGLGPRDLSRFIGFPQQLAKPPLLQIDQPSKGT